MADSAAQVVGNVTRDPELTYTASGAPLLKLSVAVNRRWKKGDDWQEEVSFFNVVAWGDLAENSSASVEKGDRVVVNGRLQQRSWTTESDEKRSVVEIVADDIALSLRFATAQATRIKRERGERTPAPATAGANDPFFGNEEPF